MKKLALAVVAILASFNLAFFAAPAPVAAVDVNPALCRGVNAVDGSNSNKCPTDSDENPVFDVINQIIDIFSIIVGAVSVIMIIVGGLRYITSAGDSGNVTAAKNTILYAIVGLVIVVFAQFIVKFVINRLSG